MYLQKRLKFLKSCKLNLHHLAHLCFNFPSSELSVKTHLKLINACGVVWNKSITENTGYNLWNFFLVFFSVGDVSEKKGPE